MCCKHSLASLAWRLLCAALVPLRSGTLQPTREQNVAFPFVGRVITRLRAQVAEGLAHVYPRLAPTCEWDTAAAHIIVEEAGGSVVQAGLCDNKGNALENWEAVLSENRPVVYNKENLLNPFFVVYGRRAEA